MLGFLKNPWLKNSNGKADAMLTFAAASFVVTSFCILLSMVESLSFAGGTITLKSPDQTLVLAYLGACFTSYVMRRNTKDKLDLEHKKLESHSNVLGE